MSRFFTGEGDEGMTGVLGKGRVPKYDLRIETLGTIDECTSALGLARASCRTPEMAGWLIAIQRDLYDLMSGVAAVTAQAGRFPGVGAERVTWLEEQIDRLEGRVTMPSEFILPGDSLGSAALDLARTVVRRAERRLVELNDREPLQNPNLLIYLNRLSSLIFLLELYEIQIGAGAPPTLAKEDK